jgi:hypothetical protein
MCLAARLLSVAVSMVIAGVLAAWGVSYGVNEGMGGIPPFQFGLAVLHFWLIPVLLIAIAWKHHLRGGALMLLYSLLPFVIAGLISVASEGHRDVSHLVLAALVFPVGAAPHLLAWWKERRRKRTL